MLQNRETQHSMLPKSFKALPLSHHNVLFLWASLVLSTGRLAHVKQEIII